MNKQRILEQIALIEVTAADLKKVLVTGGLFWPAGFVAMVDGIRHAANEIGNECWMDAMRDTMAYRSWGERGGQRVAIADEPGLAEIGGPGEDVDEHDERDDHEEDGE